MIDPNGNLYSCFRDNGEADLRYVRMAAESIAWINP